MRANRRRPAAGLRYRPEIDGLRALAILPVILFHFGVPGFGGGFVGVDVFFVISGYLIAGLISGEMELGRFSLLHFYERRVRRIFPALFALLAAVSAAALILLFPVDLVRYAKSLFATALFGANFEFWRETGYFGTQAGEKPLLHLWSIAAEEQFYLLFPAFLMMWGRESRGWRLSATAAVLAVSFAFSACGVVHARYATFYLLPARAWELMMGVLLALGAIPQIRNRAAREGIAGLGLALIALAVVSFRSDMPFPGPYALVPCAGAAFVIHAAGSRETGIGRVLSLRPLVFVGLISYSLYLWHWPLLVFARYAVYGDLSALESAALIVLSFVLAALSWRFVERPFRHGVRPLSRRALFIAAASAMALTVGVAVLVEAADGLPQRLGPGLLRILAAQEDHEPRIARCFALSARDVVDGRLCRIGATPVKVPNFILWVDSHADAILPAVTQAATRAGRAGLFAGGAACPPLLGVTTPMPDCRPFNAAVAGLALRPNIAEVILEARWAKYAEGSTYGDEPRGHVALVDNESGSPASADNHAVFARGLERTVRTLTQSGKTVVLVASVPEIGWPVPAVLARRALAGDRSSIDLPTAVFDRRQAFAFAVFARLHRIYGVKVLYPHRIFCSARTCRVAVAGVPLYRDAHHLSVYGALRLGPLIDGAF